METVLSRLRTLGPDELRMEIINAGLKCGPITATTRALFEKKLASSILESQRSDGEASELNSNTDASPSNMCDGGDFGYSLGLNPPEEPSMARLDIATSCVNTEDGFTPQRDRHESPSQFYGVCPPMLDVILDDETVHVYENKKDAMKAVKKMKGARFKIFSSREAAEKFARGTSESSSSPCKAAPDLSPRKPDEPPNPEVEHLNGEKANNYKTPRTQDLTGKLRKAVENGDWAAFSELVWSNPRYLIGSGDNPTIVQEGCRYNIMHVAAKENQPGIAQLLLDTLENPEFMRHMYPDDKEDMLRNRIRYVVDLYLNTPDKAAFETPLHFACKFGCPEVVKVLCSHPDTDKNCKNKYSQKPFSVICERKNKTQEIKQKIKEYLEDQYYVPLLRATDNSSQPVIGAPQSPEHLDQVPHWLGPELQGNPKDPVMTVRAVAGPLSQTKAEEFRKTWKNPPRDRASYFHHILKSDPNRGAERVGRELAHELGYLWEEYWEFLGTFVNLAAADGLEVLEGYLNKKDYSEADSEETRKSRTGDCIKGKTRNICNSISVGAFLDENSPHEDAQEIRKDATMRSSGGFPSPVSNLMAEFEKASVLDSERPSDRTCEGDREDGESEDTSSVSSEEYFTAEEDEEGEDDEAPTNALQNRKPSKDGSESSSSSYRSLHGSQEDLTVRTTPPVRQGLFIEGESPTKLDIEVLSALKGVDIDPRKYPCVDKWKSTIQGFTSSQMQSWPSPVGVKNWPRTPGSPCSPTLSPGSPNPTRYNHIHRLYQSHFHHSPG